MSRCRRRGNCGKLTFRLVGSRSWAVIGAARTSKDSSSFAKFSERDLDCLSWALLPCAAPSLRDELEFPILLHRNVGMENFPALCLWPDVSLRLFPPSLSVICSRSWSQIPAPASAIDWRRLTPAGTPCSRCRKDCPSPERRRIMVSSRVSRMLVAVLWDWTSFKALPSLSSRCGTACTESVKLRRCVRGAGRSARAGAACFIGSSTVSLFLCSERPATFDSGSLGEKRIFRTGQ
mmetsp:Transcript_18463/g.69858  ORF Transcript_18463/g.69858 Transcript_18463/m.69858 type:complete len:235 (+) Transcript_18463:109-813(+)